MIQRQAGELWHCDSLGGCQGKAQVKEYIWEADWLTTAKELNLLL